MFVEKGRRHRLRAGDVAPVPRAAAPGENDANDSEVLRSHDRNAPHCSRSLTGDGYWKPPSRARWVCGRASAVPSVAIADVLGNRPPNEADGPEGGAVPDRRGKSEARAGSL